MKFLKMRIFMGLFFALFGTMSFSSTAHAVFNQDTGDCVWHDYYGLLCPGGGEGSCVQTCGMRHYNCSNACAQSGPPAPSCLNGCYEEKWACEDQCRLLGF